MSLKLVHDFQSYSDWRSELANRLLALRNWLHQQELGDAEADLRIEQALEKLREDKLVVAFIAEFSRGKSELINAIFFADFGQRLLPSSAGRTTMCPTELLFDPTRPPSIQLLPIETRSKDAPVSEYKQYPEEWVTQPLDLSSADRMGEILARVSETKAVSIEVAHEYGLYDESDALNVVTVRADGTVDIPSWRHAIINFPHPLLKQGLVILDTPGLNAIGTEPELTLNLLPNAHAILFILTADTGVTKTDIEVWRNHINEGKTGAIKGRVVVLNKIDGLWDELKSAVEIEVELKRQISTSAALLGVAKRQVFPISAQKALVAKINGDDALLEKSRLPALEKALSDELIPAKQEIVSESVQLETRQICNRFNSLLQIRLNSLQEQLNELTALRGKNRDVVDLMLEKAQHEKQQYEKGLQHYLALRNVFSQHTNNLFSYLSKDGLRTRISKTKLALEKSTFPKDIRIATAEFFKRVKDNIEHSGGVVSEIHEMMDVMYRKFGEEHGLNVATLPPFSMLKYQKELDKLERSFNLHANTLWNMLSRNKATLQRKFFETVGARVKQIYDVANRDVDIWLKSIMTPMEGQVREQQVQHRRRIDSIQRIHGATEELEERIVELEQVVEGIRNQQKELLGLQSSVDNLIQAKHVAQHLAA